MGYGTRILSLFFLWFFLFGPGFCVEGAQKGDEDLLEELLEVKISTAAKYEQTLGEAPASVTIITSEDIDRFGYRTLDEVLMRIRGFYITNDRNYSYVGVRGFSRPTDYNNRILLLINGHSTTENIWGSTTIGTDLGLDLDAVDRIEIVRGPGSALYGTNAMLAVINIITRDGRSVNGLGASIQTGSFGKIQGGLRFGKELKNGLDFMVSGLYGDVKGADLYFEEFDEPPVSDGTAEGLDWDRYYGVFASLRYKELSFQGMATSREKGIPTAPYETSFNDDRIKTLDARQFIALKYEGDISYNKRVMIRGYFNHYIYYGAFPYDDPDYETLWEEKSIGEWFGLESQFNWDIRPNNRLILGAEYENHFRAYYHSWDEFETFFDQNFPFNEWSFYIQDEYQVVKNLSFTLGLRYDKYSDRDRSLSPRAALIYNPFKASTLKLLYGNAYRAPNFYELYYEDENEAKGNPFLKNEKINTFEAVLEQQIGERIFAVLCLYSFEMKGLIEQEIDPVDELLQFHNLEKVKGKGLELGLSIRLRNGVSGYLNYNYQCTKNIFLDERISNSPDHGLKFGLSVPLFKYLSAAVETFYESGRMTVYGSQTEPYLLTNFHLCSNELYRHFKFSLQVKNLFDIEYRTPGGYEHIQHALIQNGRNFTLKFEWIL